MKELKQHYEWIDNQNQVGKGDSMSVPASSSIGGGKKCPSPESNPDSVTHCDGV